MLAELRRPEGGLWPERSERGPGGTAGRPAPLSFPTGGRPPGLPPRPPPQPRRERAAGRPAALAEGPQGAGCSARRGAAFPPARPPLRGRSLRRRSGGAGPPGGREEVSGTGAGAGGDPLPILAGRLLRPAAPAVAPWGFPRCPLLWRRAPAAASPVFGQALAGLGGVGESPPTERGVGSGSGAGCGPAAAQGAPVPGGGAAGGPGSAARALSGVGRDGGGRGGDRPGGGVAVLVTAGVVVAAGDAGQDLGPAELLWGWYPRRAAARQPVEGPPACTRRPAGPSPQPAARKFPPERVVTNSVTARLSACSFLSSSSYFSPEQFFTSVSPSG